MKEENLMTLISPIKLNIAEKLEKDKKFRSHFFRVQAQDRIAMNIKKLRKKREKTQIALAKETKMLQSAVSRIEQADYCGWSLNTLLRVADALEARLRVSFEPVEDVIGWYKEREAVAIEKTSQFVDIYTSRDNSKKEVRTKDLDEAASNKVIPFAPILNDQASVYSNNLELLSAQSY
jgi:transcriptional regulator with XRE-family HTH domain